MGMQRVANVSLTPQYGCPQRPHSQGGDFRVEKKLFRPISPLSRHVRLAGHYAGRHQRAFCILPIGEPTCERKTYTPNSVLSCNTN